MRLVSVVFPMDQMGNCFNPKIIKTIGVNMKKLKLDNIKQVKFFTRSKKAIAISMAVATISSVGFTTHLSASDADSKFRAVSSSKAVKGQYIIVLKEQQVNQQVSIMSGHAPLNATAMMEYRRNAVANIATEMSNLHNAKVNKQYHAALSGFSAQMSQKDMRVLLADERVAFIEQDQIMRANVTQTGATWGLDRIDQADLPLDGNFTYTPDGSGVNAYVIDTGVMVGHSDFGGRAQNGWDFVDNDSVANDCNGHGTHVAGSIAGTTWGVAKNVTVVGIRVLDCAGSGSNADVIAGVDWVTANAVHPAVTNMSLGGGSSTALDNAVQAAIDSGVTFVVAAGNSNSDACVGSPNRVVDALTVASSTSSDARSSFSNWGSCIDLFAPGSSITSTWSDGGTNTISGTSMAAPHVAGVAALYLQDNPSANPAAVNAAVVGNTVSGKISDVAGSPNLLLQSDFGSVAPPPPPSGDDILEKGVSKTGLSANRLDETFYTIEIPAGATELNFDTSGGTGDADLYVRFGSAPTTSSYDCRPYRNGNNENCNFTTASTGTYHVMIRAYSTYSGVSLVADYTPASGGGNGSFFETTTDVNIPDNNSTGVRGDLEVDRAGQAGSIDIHVDIKHTYVGDLKIEIFAPDGASAVLRDQTGGSSNDIDETFTINAGTRDAAGTWQLRVSDHAGADIGYIDSWSITFE